MCVCVCLCVRIWNKGCKLNGVGVVYGHACWLLQWVLSLLGVHARIYIDARWRAKAAFTQRLIGLMMSQSSKSFFETRHVSDSAASDGSSRLSASHHVCSEGWRKPAALVAPAVCRVMLMTWLHKGTVRFNYVRVLGSRLLLPFFCFFDIPSSSSTQLLPWRGPFDFPSPAPWGEAD